MCASLRDALEASGPFIPRMVRPAASLPAAQDADLKIVQKPIIFDDVRMKLTLDYIRKHSGELVSGIEFTPRMIVLHRTNIDTLEGSYEALRPLILPQPQAGQSEQAQREVNSSVHYLVDKDGSIYSLMLDFYIDRHVVGLDRYAIGISNVGSDAASMTNAQLQADQRLIQLLTQKYNNILWLMGASEAEAFKGTNYREVAADPGNQFMSRLRTQIAKLQLKSAP